MSGAVDDIKAQTTDMPLVDVNKPKKSSLFGGIFSSKKSSQANIEVISAIFCTTAHSNP